MAQRDTTGLTIYNTNQAGHIAFAHAPSQTLPTDSGKFATGCILVLPNGKAYMNTVPALSAATFVLVTPNFADKMYFEVAVLTTGATPVNVFGAGGAPAALTVTAVLSIAQDTTAGNITLKQAANTVVTIAKGVTSGGVVGGVSLANTVYAAGDVCTVQSSSAGNSIVKITFTVA